MSTPVFSHPGVSLHTKIKGGVINFMFRDSFDKGKQKIRSSKTNEWEKASKLAEQLSEALRSKPDEIKDQYDKLIYDILQIQPFERKLAKAKEALEPGDIEVMLPAKPGRPRRLQGPRFVTKKRDPASIQAAEELLSQLEHMRKQREYWRAKAIKAEAALGRKLSDAEIKSGPRTLKKAIADFMNPDKSDLKASGQSRYAVQKWIERFAKDYGEETDVNEVSTEQVIAHLSKFREQAKLSDIYCYVTKFMIFATHAQFNREPVKKWFDGVRQQRKAAGKDTQSADWFWLTAKECKSLLDQLKKDAGDYWTDAATIQYGCGFRPEELPLLKTDAVKIAKGKASIALTAPEGRRLKTTRSRDAVNVPAFAMQALERRLKAGTATLFPYSQSGCELAPYLLAKRTERDADLDLWPSADDHEWSFQYLARLRAAAKKVMAKHRADKVNSKTMRHTCGRELILAHGFDKAAAVLRHDVQTLKKHYADLMTSDVSTER